jgi:5'-nucleotidase
MTQQIIFVDVDGVAADSITYWINLYNADYKQQLKKTDITQYDIKPFIIPYCNFAQYFTHYEEVKTEKNAKWAIEKLWREYRVVFATAGKIESLNWLQVNFGIKEIDYVFCKDKSLLRGDILVDDKPENLWGFQGKRFLFRQPWNEGEWTWETIVEDLL